MVRTTWQMVRAIQMPPTSSSHQRDLLVKAHQLRAVPVGINSGSDAVNLT